MITGIVWLLAIGITFLVFRKHTLAGVIVGVILLFAAYKITQVISIGSSMINTFQETRSHPIPKSDISKAEAELPGLISTLMNGAVIDMHTNLFDVAGITKSQSPSDLLNSMVKVTTVIDALEDAYNDPGLHDALFCQFEQQNGTTYSLTPQNILTMLNTPNSHRPTCKS